MTPVAVCTVASRRELAQVRSLARALTEHNPGWRLQFLVIDDPGNELAKTGEPFDLIGPEALGLDLHAMHVAASYLEVDELKRALVPSLLLTLLRERGHDVAIFLDPFAQVFASLAPLATLAAQHPVALTPFAGPPASDGEFASSDWYPGFIVATAAAVESLEWWQRRFQFSSAIDPIDGARRWLDWVELFPAYYDALGLRDSPYAVGYWNAAGRAIEATSAGYRIDGAPLATFHFRGFDPKRPWILSVDQGVEPPVLLSENEALDHMCRSYADAVINAGYDAEQARGYGWSLLPDGNRVSRRIQEAIKVAVAGHEQGDEYQLPPDPFDADTLADFYRWLASPEPANEKAPTVARFFYPIYEARLDLRLAFPDLAVVDAEPFREWSEKHSRGEYTVPDAVYQEAFVNGGWPSSPSPTWSTDVAALKPGFLVAGYLRADLGIGDAARRGLQAMGEAQLPSAALPFAVTNSRQLSADSVAAAQTDFDTNVIWVNPDQLGFFIRHVGADYFAGRYTVGSWAWETENMPPEMGAMGRFVDEIWALSDFTAAAIAPVAPVPVYVFEPPVTVPVVDTSIDTGALGVPDGFVFLFMFDFFSTIARKNPVGLIQAFSRAFRPDEGPRLVIKSINGSRVALDFERVRLAAQDRPDIVLIDSYMSGAEYAALLARADCYVSLHRAEGFGLTIAESLALGKPVVATGYSGNLSFMSDDTSYLVPTMPVAVGLHAPPYPPEGIWGEPDIEAAAGLLRRVYEAPDEARAKAAKGRAVILSEHGPRRAAEFVATRFVEIHKKRQRGSGFASPVLDAVREALATPYWAGNMPGSVPRSSDP